MKLLAIPRIIGIITIIASAIAYYFQLSGTIISGIMGLVLIIAPAKHSQEMLHLCLKTFTKWKTLTLTALYDAIHWSLIFGAVALFVKWEALKAASAQATATLTREAILKPELAAQTANALQGFLTYTLIAGILLLIICLIIYTISRGLIWARIAKIKLTKKFFLKLLVLNSLWWLIWLPIYALIAIGAARTNGAKEAFVVLFILGIYATPILHALFTKKQRIGYSLGHGIAYSITKIHKLIIPYTYAFLINIIAYQPLRLIQNTSAFKPAAILFVVLYFAWLRMYLYEIIKQFK